ncbi:exoprotein [Altererythrobacter sp. RZ02]|uniref:Exoprotein n=1 Tax=Pontixanthobacter rizhaonensis TaxID=2730337 RepID=A0A848QRE0_9SPHN|nr:YdbH domain-containing protein [Pontixanthobacter rizhaonensis]NMW31668.1 exoprotein [Pontixanthobacter rizhaonensis]
MPASSDIDGDIATESVRPKKRKLLRRLAFLLLGFVIGAALLGWFTREDIARDLIGDELAKLDLPASYDVEQISADRQVLTNIVVGDPSDPDLTIEKVEVELVYGFGAPELGKIVLTKPRLYGTYSDGQMSFGSLDPVLFAESDAPPGLPDLDATVIDGRGLLDTDFGRIGWKVDGAGGLDDGFAGIAAVTAPEVQISGCSAGTATLYGQLSTADGALSLDGPVRLRELNCRDAGVRADTADASIDLTVDPTFAQVELAASLETGAFSVADALGDSIAGPVKLTASSETMTASFDLQAARLSVRQARIGSFAVDGTARLRDGYRSAEVEANLAAAAIDVGPAISGLLGGYSAPVAGTLLEPLLAKFDTAQRAQLRGASFTGLLNARNDQGGLSLVMPQGAVRNDRGGDVLSLSRIEYRQASGREARVSGNFRMGGGGLPAIAGRMEQHGSDSSIFRLKMQRYAAGENWIELPELLVEQSKGAVRFDGAILANGILPGGAARNLTVPLQGSWAYANGLSLWRSCTSVSFDSLSFASLDLASRGLTLCPPPGGAIVRQDAQGLRIAAGTSSLVLNGKLADTDIAMSSGPVGIAYPGIAKAKAVEVVLGPAAEANRFAVTDLTANFRDTISGSFTDADIQLFAVPLDISETAGEWAYADDVLTISDAAFTITDRNEFARFEPLSVQGGSLTLFDNMINADATLRHPASQREISRVDIRHDLGSAVGFANINVDRLQFDEGLQPDQLTDLALGVVANVSGAVAGKGRIDWNPEDVSSFGRFFSDALDFAAVFGPVKGARGEVEFTDLLSLTTAPNQQIFIASINPGIEARDGIIGFSLNDGQFLGVTGGSWPFMGGTLKLRPTQLNLAAAEERRYILEVDALDAALFVEDLELGNLSATGIFDGSLQIVFDELGFGKIESGVLQSRAPGGTVSYVGELTYEDLSPIANYAFKTLRSLDYETMQIGMEGALTGDIVTRVRFDGVKQGKGTEQNFITRQIADLPIRLNVNIRAPFYKLLGTYQSIYDPSTQRDPRDLGLVGPDGNPIAAPQEPAPADPSNPNIPSSPDIIDQTNAVRPSEPSIQTSDSEIMP